MIRRLAGCIKQYRKDTILSPLFISMEVVMEVLIPFLMARLIDNGIETGNMPYIWKMGLVLVLSALVSLVFGTLAGIAAANASAGFATNLRQEMYYRVQNFSFANIDKFSAASIITRLTTDVAYVQQAFMMIIRIGVRAPVMMIFSLVMAFSINSRLALIFVVVLPFLALGLYLIIRKVHPIFERVFRTYDRLNNVVQENLRGIRVVKSFVREDHEVRKFEAVSQDIYKDFVKAEKLIAWNAPMMQTAVYSCILLVSWIGAKLVVAGSMTTGQLVSMFTYIMMILMNLMMLSFIFVMIIISRASAERINEILTEMPDLKNGASPIYDVKDGSVQFDQVGFSYAGREDKLCLSGINFKIGAGETIGIIGATGSSKSSLIQLIPRLYDATQGTVKVGGVDVRDYDLETLRNQVAVVLQKNVLFSGTIKENLRWGNPNASDEELVQACQLAQAHDFIQSFPNGYDTYIEQGGANVSGGQKQRLCIARALLKHPKILILDDSTSAVDTRTDAQIRQAFREQIPGTTRFIIAQRIASVSDADRIMVLDGGRIEAIGTHEELLQNNKIYQEVYQFQMKGDFDESR